jgi:signal transduction histidine kinase
MNRSADQPTWAGPALLARVARRGFVEVLVTQDGAPILGSRPRRWAVGACTALGSALFVVAVLGVLFALARSHLYSSPPPPPYSGAWRPPALEISAALSIVLLAVRYPLLAWRIGYLIVLLVPLMSGEPRVNVVVAVALVVAFVAAGLRHARLVLWSMWTLMLAPVWIWLGPRPAAAALAMAALTVVTVALDARAATRKAGHALAEQVAQTEHEGARRAVLEERARIAREMHDVVAHHMSMIAVQAETAPYRLSELSATTPPKLTDRTVAEFASLSSAARAALTDLRRVLGVLRSDEVPERSPQPQLSDVPQLVEATRRAGVPVELSMSVGDDYVPASVGLCAYRIVQEALSNAGRHAPGSNVVINIELDQRLIRLEVTNGPPSPANPTAATQPTERRTGHGLPGMRERVSLLGGSLSAVPTQDGGYAVSATIPLARA